MASVLGDRGRHMVGERPPVGVWAHPVHGAVDRGSSGSGVGHGAPDVASGTVDPPEAEATVPRGGRSCACGVRACIVQERPTDDASEKAWL